MRSQTRIRPRRELHQTFQVVGRQFLTHGLQKRPHRFLGDVCVAPGELLELFVWLVHRALSHDGLDGLRENGPVAIELLRHLGFVDVDSAQATLGCFVGDDTVDERGAPATLHCGVGEIALHARNGKLLRQVGEQGVGNTKVSLRILEVDGVDLMRHGRRSDLTLDHLQLQQISHDVHPHVPTVTEQNRVESGEMVAQFRLVIVALDLRAESLVGQAEFGNVPLSERRPVHIGVRDGMRVEIAGSAVDFAHEFDVLNFFDMVVQTVLEHLHFFSKGRGGGGLAVG